MKKFLLLFTTVFILSACGQQKQVQDAVAEADYPSDKLVVAATFFPLYDIVKNIGGDVVEVVNVVPAGVSPHTFELTPTSVKSLSEAKLIFSIGHSIDDWIVAITDSLPDVKIATVDAGIELMPFEFEEHEDEWRNEDDHEGEEGEHEDEEGHGHEEGGLDPHYWLTIDNSILIATNVESELSKLDPANSAYYKSNLAKYAEELSLVDAEVRTLLDPLKGSKLLVFHDAWGYFAREYGLEIAGVFVASPGKEPSPQYLKELYDLVKENNIKAVFVEPQLSIDVAQAFFPDLGLKSYALDPEGALEFTSYAEMMKYNAKTIAEALVN